MKPFRLGFALVLPALLGLLAACQAPSAGSSRAALVQFHADSNVRNPAANDAFPGVRRIVLRAVDGRVRPDAALQVSDRVALSPGERSLLFAAESVSGRLTLSELSLSVEPGVDYVVRPVVTREGGAILAEIRRGPYGEVLGRSSLWTKPDGAGN